MLASAASLGGLSMQRSKVFRLEARIGQPNMYEPENAPASTGVEQQPVATIDIPRPVSSSRDGFLHFGGDELAGDLHESMGGLFIAGRDRYE